MCFLIAVLFAGAGDSLPSLVCQRGGVHLREFGEQACPFSAFWADGAAHMPCLFGAPG